MLEGYVKIADIFTTFPDGSPSKYDLFLDVEDSDIGVTTSSKYSRLTFSPEIWAVVKEKAGGSRKLILRNFTFSSPITTKIPHDHGAVIKFISPHGRLAIISGFKP